MMIMTSSSMIIDVSSVASTFTAIGSCPSCLGMIPPASGGSIIRSMTMDMYEWRSEGTRGHRWWTLASVMIISVGMCVGAALIAVDNLFGPDEEITSSLVAISPSATVGQSVRDGGMEFVVETVDCSPERLGRSPVDHWAEGRFCVVKLSITNQGDSAKTLLGSMQTVVDDRGLGYPVDEPATLLVTPDIWSNQIGTGVTVQGAIVFDVPARAHVVAVVLHGGAFSQGVKVMIG